MQKTTGFRVFTLIAIILAAATAFGQSGGRTAKQSEEDKQLALLDEQAALMRNPENLRTEVFEAENDEHKVRVYRLFLKVPERKPRKAEWVAIHYRLQVTYHVATSQRREAWTEAMLLGADAMETMKIDREFYEAEGNILGKTTSAKMRYFAGSKLIASRDVLAGDADQRLQTLNRILELEAFARVKSGN